MTILGGVDYNSGPYNITFPAGVTSVSFNITIINDTVLEDNETLLLTIIILDVLPNIVIPGENNHTNVTIVNDGGTGK